MQKGGVIGKRLRKELGGPTVLLDTPDLIFAQTASPETAHLQSGTELQGGARENPVKL